MKRMLHRLLSAALALLMTATFVLPGFAAGDEPAAADPTGIAIALPPNLTVGVGQTVDLYLAVEPFTALPEQVTWTSSDGATLTVTPVENSQTHVQIQGLKATEAEQTVELTAKLSDGTTAACPITVTDDTPAAAGSVWIAPRRVSLDLGGTATFHATVSTTSQTGQTVSWSVAAKEGTKADDTQIDPEGKLTIGAKESAAALTVTATVGGVSDSVEVAVIQPVIQGLTIETKDATTVQPGGRVTFTGTLDYTGNLPQDDQKIGWTVTGKDGLEVDTGTQIGADGVLTIGENQQAGTLTVTGSSSENYCETPRTDSIEITVKAKGPVEPEPTYSLSVSPESVTLAGQKVGYATAPSAELTLQNTGNQTIDKLTFTLEGRDAASFSVAPSSLEKLAAGKDGKITLSAVSGLKAGDYTASLKITDGKDLTQIIPVTFVVGAQTSYSASLTPEGTITFPTQQPGYTVPEQTFTLENTGSGTLTNLGASLSGAQKESFDLKNFTGGSLDLNGKLTFTVAPKAGLTPGSYQATLEVTADAGIALTRALSFTVTAAGDFSLTPGGNHNFGTLETGYTAPSLTVTVENTGGSKLEGLRVTLTGDQASQFTATQPAATALEVGGKTTFTLAPAGSLPTGSYKAAVEVAAQGGLRKSFDISFQVIDKVPDYSLTLDPHPSTRYTFPSRTVGYPDPPQYTIQLTNTGKNTLTNLRVQITGADSGRFGLLQPVRTLEKGRETQFTLAPIRGLAPGSYQATVTLTADRGIKHSFDIRFTVEAGRDYAIAFDREDNYTFPTAVVGYTTAPVSSMTVRNTGNLATGALQVYLRGKDADRFTLSSSRIASLKPGEEVTLQLQPKRGLAAGHYDDVVLHIQGEHDLHLQKSFSFTVTRALPIIVTPTSLDFGIEGTGYASFRKLDRTLTVKNTGGTDLNGMQVSFAGGDKSVFTCPTSVFSIPKNGTSTLTVTPKMGLKGGSYTDTLILQLDGASYQIPLLFRVTDYTPVLPTVTRPSEGATLTIRGADYYEDFNAGVDSSVWVDGVRLDESQYTHQAGSVIIYLKPQFVRTLKNGDHLVEVRMARGQTVFAPLTVKSSGGGWHITYPNYDNDNEHWADPPKPSKPKPNPAPSKPNPGTGGI